ncbi:MAG TPA: SDR family oxidoreductase [Fluviicoccus sp.]|nr:SDR family oxidoreductase [Fluviicoccus sp.]
MKQFYGKKVVVTGAAGGIGRLMALAFAGRGCDVVVTDINVEGAEKVAAEIRGVGRQSWAYRLDLSQPGEIRAFRDRVRREAGRIDALVNNAGVVYGGVFEMVPIEKHLMTYAVNTAGLVAMTHAFFPDLLESEESHILNIASASGFVGLPFGATYASSKWAVIGFSESIRLELQERGFDHVGVTTVCPGYIATGMFDGVRTPKLLPFLDPERIVAKIMEGVEKNHAYVKEPFMVKSVDILKGALPQKMWDKAAHALGITSSMMHWKGHGR